jgi:flagellar hook-length control protein FliK
MDLSALESLLRTDNGSANQPRRFADNSGERFAQLLGQADNKSRSSAPSHARRETRNDDFAARPQRNDRHERPERAERPERNERPEKAERPEKNDRPAHADKAQAEKARAEKAAAEKNVSDKGETAKDSDAKDTDVVAAKPADNTAADEASIDKDTQAKTDAADADANASTGVSPELVKMSALAAAHQIGLMMAKVNGEAAAEGGEAVAGADAKAAKQQLELATGAHPGVKPQTAEAVEEDFADFVIRGAANPAAMAAAAANDDGEAKAEAKADAKADAKGQMIVTMSQPMAMAAPVAPVVALAVQASAQAQAGSGEISLDADKAANAALAGDDKAKANAKPADANPMFGQALDRAQGTQSSQAAAETKPRAPIVPPHEQVAVHVRKAVDDGQNQITIRLNPTELGRIDVKLEVGRDGTLRASFAAEQAHTLEALRNDSRQLERALQEAGLKPDAGGLNFSMRGDNRENAQAFADMGREQRGRANWNDGTADNSASAAPAPIQANYRAARRAAGGLDLAV